MRINLEADSFTIFSSELKQGGWIDFSLQQLGGERRSLGSQDAEFFLNRLLGVLKRSSGRRLSDIPNVRFSEILIEQDAEYIGNVFFDGYVTLYIFRVQDIDWRCIISSAEGQKIEYSRFDPSAWIGELETASKNLIRTRPPHPPSA